jgi:aspartyl-tRNA(Asn)/glutamyl-tRNA(Gln) amidotransferase subunit C
MRGSSMALTPEKVADIARLARLRISPEDVPAYVRNLSRIIDFVAQLERADTGAVEPMAHPLDMNQRLRADEVTEAVDRDHIQRNAPAVEAGHYVVPKVIE